ncbi:MAG TPA: hypothetical protein VM012_01010 [Flavitalea sp.]|nr:hypothetical protein [Flavitalea sp.]
MRKINFLLLTLFSISIFSCQKSDDENKNTQGNLALISSAAWKYESAGLDVNKDGQMDTGLPVGFVMACDTDNTLTFKSDMTGVVDEGAVKCDPGNPQSTPFTWVFKNGESMIHFNQAIFTGVDGDVSIKGLTESKLELHKEINIGAPQTVNVIVKLKH